MKIVSWNCNGAFRKKFKNLDNMYNADIYVIQECENPDLIDDKEYKEFTQNGYWTGYKNKGLGVFAKKHVKLELSKIKTYGLQFFMPCRVNDEFNLLGVWACGKYIEELYVFLQIYKDKCLDIENTIICGDFNSNSIWDKLHRNRNHSITVNELSELGLVSCYHTLNNRRHGEEGKATFYQHRDENKGYYIDYFFCNKESKYDLEIGKKEEWITDSDHMPLVYKRI